MLHISSDSANPSWLRKIALDHVTYDRNDHFASVLLTLADVKTAARSIVERTTMVLDSISKTVEEMEPGDVILGFRSSGIRSNGLTLARKLLGRRETSPRITGELLRPTRIYMKPILCLLRSGVKIHGLAHITGGAFSKLRWIGLRAKVGFMFDNIPEPQWIFREIQTRGRVSDREMYRTFNMGTGFLVICSRKATKRIRNLLPEIRRVGYVTSYHSAIVLVAGKEVEIETW